MCASVLVRSIVTEIEDWEVARGRLRRRARSEADESEFDLKAMSGGLWRQAAETAYEIAVFGTTFWRATRRRRCTESTQTSTYGTKGGALGVSQVACSAIRKMIAK